MAKHPMTKEGEDLLRKELKKLKSEDRSKVVQAIAEARELGDLKENAEYHSAKEQQGFIERRIREIESKLSNSQVIDVTKVTPSGKVVFGTTIELDDLEGKKQVKYKIVGEDESDAKAGKISFLSPLARILIGKNQGDEIEIEAPEGKKHYRIVLVKHI
ncbi:uncharacterized protein METZ01_LOCUS173843 [marine metagenome]|uniref:Transcription elongation factor GreA n=1 Tax=marine metagenome TaxID=408172 RepID=A0A382C545_9ZZZZ